MCVCACSQNSGLQIYNVIVSDIDIAAGKLISQGFLNMAGQVVALYLAPR